MTTNLPETDLPDSDLQALFAGVHPSPDFEARLISAVHQHRRMRLNIPLPVQRAAIAAAAVLMVGSVGYFGNRAILKNQPFRQAMADSNQQLGLERPWSTNGEDSWDFRGGSNPSQNWLEFKSGLTAETHHDRLLSARFAPTKSPYDNLDSTLLPNRETETTLKSFVGAAGMVDTPKVPPALPSPGAPSPAPSMPVSPSPAIADSYWFSYRDGRMGQPTNANPSPGSGGYNGPIGGKTSATPLGTHVGKEDVTGLTYFHGNTSSVPPLVEPLFFQTRNPDAVAGDQQRAEPAAKLPGIESGRDGPGAEKSKVMPDALVKSDKWPEISELRDKKNTAGEAVAVFIPANLPVGQPLANPTTAPAIDDRKIIRTGSMEFEVDRFDTAQAQITKIVNELGGFVGATDSNKLPNGKVRGSIAVRVPPERLDVLVLSLRALGDLKSQQITAADITKEYTDVQSELTADRAMQTRLLDLIQNSKGSVKDLLAAENELGNWRTKIEKAEGLIRYYNAQVSLSTLSITLSERDIQSPATAIETETADVGIEAEDVEKARNQALKTIDDAKGRIVEAELKRFDAGQLAAKLVADVPPESAGAVIDQLKQLGKVARLEVHRQQSNSDGSTAVSVPASATNTPPPRTERRPTRLLISIYNLANVAPRRTTAVNLAAPDVEAAYAALSSVAKSSGGRVVTSTLDRADPSKASGTLLLEIPAEKFGTAMTTLHANGEILKLNLSENPDTQNTTDAKQGLNIRLISMAVVPPRESVQQTIAASDVPAAYQAILSAAVINHAQVDVSSLNEQDRQNITAEIQLQVPRTSAAELDKALAAAGGIVSRTSSQSADGDGTVDSKLQLKLTITSADHLAPRETTRLGVEVSDVDKSAGDVQAAVISAGGRVLEANIVKDRGKGAARLTFDFPLGKAGEMLQCVRNEGTVRSIDSSRDAQAPAGPLAHAQIYVEFRTADAIVADQTSPWASVRQGLTTSIEGLLLSLKWVVVGLCLIGPWAVLLWIGWKLWQRRRRAQATVPRS